MKTKKDVINELLKDKKLKCKFCGKTANYQLHKNKNGDIIFCCEEKARRCKEYNNFKKKTHITRIGTPEQIKAWKYNLKKGQNKMSTKAAKSDKMLKLHHSTDERSIEFQKKFRISHLKRRKDYEDFIKIN